MYGILFLGPVLHTKIKIKSDCLKCLCTFLNVPMRLVCRVQIFYKTIKQNAHWSTIGTSYIPRSNVT